MNYKENVIRSIHFEKPDYIPMRFEINTSCWNHYNHDQLFDLMEEHTFLFPDFVRPNKPFTPVHLVNALSDEPYQDAWGCLWETMEDGIIGVVRQHPLKSWDNFDQYLPPDVLQTDGTYSIDWEITQQEIQKLKKADQVIWGGLPHGHTFLRLLDIRGYENLMKDMFDENPNLLKLIQMVEDFNHAFLKKYIELQPDIVTIPEDLGMQVGPMLMPKHFRKYIKPSYQRYVELAKRSGYCIHMHSDGDIRTLIDDIVDSNIRIINLQDLVNGIDWIKDKLSGRVCIDLDIDRQLITPFKSPQDIDSLILEEVTKLGSKEGGLMMIYGLYPNIPIENVKALMDAMEKYASYYSG